MDHQKVLGWFPGSTNFGEVKGHCMWTMTPAQRLLTRGEGAGALWGGHKVALTASHSSVVFAWAANHLRKECTQVRRGQAGGAEDRVNTTSPDASGMMG